MLRRMLVLSGPLLALAGCGFALRQAPKFVFRSIYLQLPESTSLGPVLTRALRMNPDLQVLTEVAQRASADVREFVLRLRLRFRLITPAGRELIPETELLLQREFGFAETAALAKEEEESLLNRDMRQDMVQQLMRRLAAVSSLTAGSQLPER